MTFRQDVYIRVHYMKSNVARRRPRRRCPSVRSFLNHPMQQRRALPLLGHGVVEVGENLRSDVAHELPDGVLSPLLALLDAPCLVDALGAAVLPGCGFRGSGREMSDGPGLETTSGARGWQGVSRRVAAPCAVASGAEWIRAWTLGARGADFGRAGTPLATGGNICERVCGGTRGAGDARKPGEVVICRVRRVHRDTAPPMAAQMG